MDNIDKLPEETKIAIARGDSIVKDEHGFDCRVLWAPLRDTEGHIVGGKPVLERI